MISYDQEVTTFMVGIGNPYTFILSSSFSQRTLLSSWTSWCIKDSYESHPKDLVSSFNNTVTSGNYNWSWKCLTNSNNVSGVDKQIVTNVFFYRNIRNKVLVSMHVNFNSIRFGICGRHCHANNNGGCFYIMQPHLENMPFDEFPYVYICLYGSPCGIKSRYIR